MELWIALIGATAVVSSAWISSWNHRKTRRENTAEHGITERVLVEIRDEQRELRADVRDVKDDVRSINSRVTRLEHS